MVLGISFDDEISLRLKFSLTLLYEMAISSIEICMRLGQERILGGAKLIQFEYLLELLFHEFYSLLGYFMNR
jgi:hypothetical protein